MTQGPYRGMGAKAMADERRQQQEAATAAATRLYADPRQSAPAAELRAQFVSQTGQSK